MENNRIKPVYADDYTQSSNALFHFMNKFEFLENILLKKAIIPRYCIEDIDYLNIIVDGKQYEKVAIIQKCFCDIPLSKITTPCTLKGFGEKFENLGANEKVRVEQNNTHTDFYGSFGIAFSKKWGEENNLQPIQYINPTSKYIESFITTFHKVADLDDTLDEVVNDIYNRLAFIKPVRGTMSRPFIGDDNSSQRIIFMKNFHDEQEWRFVPEICELEKLEKDLLIANSNILTYEYLNPINENIATDEYKELWLKYDYDDIRYIIVPDAKTRLEVIKIILSISGDKFDNIEQIDNEKHIMISKILVLDEIRRDW